MRTQKVIVGDPERKIIVSPIHGIETVGRAVRSLVGTVKTFDHLLKRPELSGNSIIVSEPDNLSDIKLKGITELTEELLSRKRVSTEAIGDETEILRKLIKVLKGHTHGHDAGTDTAVIRGLIADDHAGNGIHDKPDIAFDTADLDVGFISGKRGTFFVRIEVDERFDTDSGCFAVVGDHLMGNGDAVDISQGLRSLSQGET